MKSLFTHVAKPKMLKHRKMKKRSTKKKLQLRNWPVRIDGAGDVFPLVDNAELHTDPVVILSERGGLQKTKTNIGPSVDGENVSEQNRSSKKTTLGCLSYTKSTHKTNTKVTQPTLQPVAVTVKRSSHSLLTVASLRHIPHTTNCSYTS